MRMMMKVTVSGEAANRGVKDGSLGKVIGQWSEQNQPEAAYFTAQDGDRTAYFFLDVKDSSQMPSLGEPFFLGFNAKVEMWPAMNAQDLKAGLEKLKL